MRLSSAVLLLSLMTSGVTALSFAPALSHCRTTFGSTLCHDSCGSSSTTVVRSNQRTRSSHTLTTMKVSSQSGRTGKGSILSEQNSKRVATAGRRGTKKFVDPGKVFVGGIPFDCTEADLKVFFKEHLGHTQNIHSMNIIRDWKTGDSKGYGFVVFSDPMFATTAMEFCKNKKLKGRILTLSQGQKKMDPNAIYVKKNKKPAVDDEEAAIQAGLESAEVGDDVSEDEDDSMSMEDFEDSDDALLFADEDDDNDEEFQYDGVFEEMYPVEYEPMSEEELALNREQRREVQKRKSRKKLPHKGFEPLSSS